MMIRTIFTLLLLLVSVACGSRQQELATTPDYGAPPDPAAEPEAFPGGASRSPGQAPYADDAADSAQPERATRGARRPSATAGTAKRRHYEPPHEEEQRALDRPGLATHWGERRDSSIRYEAFVRGDAHNPLDVLNVRYDDYTGVYAATGVHRRHLEPHAMSLAGGALTVRLVDSSGSPLPSTYRGSVSHVVGERGERYQLEIKNHTQSRFEIVASVDGLDVVDGSPGSFSKRGYLVGPYDSLTIEGFRVTHDEVAAFRFGNVGHSYAAQRGLPQNVGVIGVAVFEERFHRRHHDELRRRERANPFPFSPPPGHYR